MRVLILGWYNRYNLGDDIFQYIFNKLFQEYHKIYKESITYQILNMEDVSVENLENADIVLHGGGAILNDFFLQKFFKKVYYVKNIHNICVSADIPYPNIVEQRKLDIFDTFVLRSKLDCEIVEKRFGSHCVQHFPDLASMVPLEQTYTEKISRNKKFPYRKNIGIFVAYQYFLNDEHREHLIQQMCDCINYLLSFNYYEIFLFSFDTHNAKYNDLKINTLIKNKFLNISEVHLILEKIHIEEISSIFKDLHFNICMRYHATFLSIMNTVPFISMFRTRKIKNLLEENYLESFGAEITDPTNFPISVVKRKFFESQGVEKYANSIQQLLDLRNSYLELIPKYKETIFQLIRNPQKRLPPPHYVFEEKTQESVEQISKIVCYVIKNYFHASKRKLLKYENRMSIGTQTPRQTYRKISKRSEGPRDSKHEISIRLSKAICTYLTKKADSPYIYGMQQNILKKNFNLLDSVKWILEDLGLTETSIPIYNNPEAKFNISELCQNELKGYHRSGWQYVVDHLKMLSNENGTSLDLYIDRTFHWSRELYSDLGIIPYKHPWVGFLHHTFCEEYTVYNSKNLFRCKLFLQSLKYCKGIYVFSKYLKDLLIKELEQIGKPHILVENLIHPTELDIPKFCMKKFLKNKNKKIIQVGAWLRDTYAIFRLNPQYNRLNIKKFALKGKNMENYFKPEWFDIPFRDNKKYYPVICRDNETTNKYVEGVINMVDELDKSVEILEWVDNEMYDELLSENIVFLNLVDASAINTLLECVVRNTPILINRLPAVEEILGKEYPFYYDNLIEASILATDEKKIHKTYKYMKKKIDKKRFSIEYFLNSIINSKIYKSL